MLSLLLLALTLILDIEHLVNLRQLSPNPVKLVQLPNGINAPGVSIGRNTGNAERLESTEGEELNSLATAPRATTPYRELYSTLFVINNR